MAIHIRSITASGTCSRCSLCRQPYVFAMGESDPGWALTETKLNRLTPPPELRAVCADCLSGEEIAQYLQPVAAFVLNELLNKHPHVEGLAAAAAFIQMRLGFDYDVTKIGRRAVIGLARESSL